MLMATYLSLPQHKHGAWADKVYFLHAFDHPLYNHPDCASQGYAHRSNRKAGGGCCCGDRTAKYRKVILACLKESQKTCII